jgi:hypothetical protein
MIYYDGPILFKDTYLPHYLIQFKDGPKPPKTANAWYVAAHLSSNKLKLPICSVKGR